MSKVNRMIELKPDRTGDTRELLVSGDTAVSIARAMATSGELTRSGSM